ncbi:MAG: APC family permease [Candidatus Micrarchaeia archaeon]
MQKLKRSLTLLDVVSLGIANIIGAGIFVLSGVAAGLAGPSVILSFIVAGFVALITAFSSAELSSFITKTGASYAYTKDAFGNLAAFFVGWFVYFDEIVTVAALSVSAAAYFNALFSLPQETLFITSIAFPILFIFLNLIGIKETSVTATFMVSLKIFALSLILLFGILYLLGNFSPQRFVPFFPKGITGMLNGAAVVFFAFLGFNTVCMVSEETKNPKETIPKALLIAFSISFIFYISIAFIEIGVMDWKSLGNVADPLAEIAKRICNNRLFFIFISFSAVVAMSSVILSSIVRGSRMVFAMARDGLLLKSFAHINERFKTPDFSIIFEGVIAIALAGIFYNNLDFLASIVNFGSLFTYLFIHLSVIKLRKTKPNAKRGFTTLYPFFPVIGAISCILLMFYLSNNAKIMAAIWGVIGAIVYFFVIKRKNAGGGI